MSARYFASGPEFLATADDVMLGRLLPDAGSVDQNQLHAWRVSIELLKRVGAQLRDQNGGPREWSVHLEYPIPRRGRRVDAVILMDDVIVSVEFKVGSRAYDPAARRQSEDYALDLRDFHAESRSRPIVPVLCATEASQELDWSPDSRDEVRDVVCTDAQRLAPNLLTIYRTCHEKTAPPLDMRAWDASAYEPTPTILEAAQALYAGHDVRELCRSDAGALNLTATTRAVLGVVQEAQRSGDHIACFVTGVPGAGKTLAGLNIAHEHPEARPDKPFGSFLSGNGPLVRVLTEVLARDSARRGGSSVAEARRTVQTTIHNVHRFIDHYVDNRPSETPTDHVVIFDEAQRAWDADKVRRFTRGRRTQSEPTMLLDVMGRHTDWAVVVALVGSGQEIHDGEAGLAEWGRALRDEFTSWRVVAPPVALEGLEGVTAPLFAGGARPSNVTVDDALHLKTSLRAYRSTSVSAWADAVVDGNAVRAREAMASMDAYPVVLTRDLDAARAWLRQQTRGQRRCGLVASSGAKRLRPWGINVQDKADAVNWFLGPPEDVRSSHYLEVAATEFDIQGLEVDWVGVCWDADFRRSGSQWACRRFRGTKWQQISKQRERQYLRNKYRVLLTRAREGMVIWVPPGCTEDPTRKPEWYDAIAAFLHRCGVPTLHAENLTSRVG